MRARTTLLALTGLVLSCSGLAERHVEPAPALGGTTPVVFVSGVTGTKLRDPVSGELAWGGTRQLFLPRDGGYRLVLPLAAGDSSRAAPGEQARPDRPQLHYEAREPLLRVRLPGWSKEIYRPLLARFEAAGYRHGDLAAAGPTDDFFFFNYDWRYGNLDSVRRLDRQLEALSAARGGIEVDLVCQSNAAKICRWLAKYGTLGPDAAEAGESWQRSYEIRKLVLAGVSNTGALRVLQLLNRGRSYVPLVGRRFTPEIFFSLRPLFEDLPAARDDLFFDESGETLEVDLFEAENWAEYGWSIFGPASSRRLRRNPRTDLFGDRRDQLEYLRRQLLQARRLQRLLACDSPHFAPVHYYLLENASSPTADRALLTREKGGWRTYFVGDRKVDRDPLLAGLAAAPGDGHAIVDSQRGLSPQEAEALVGTATATGGHFEAVIQPESLDAILGFLAEPVD